MAYRIRIILDVPKDVIRDIVIDENSNLEDFHLAIATSFGFKGQEMASFYRTNDSWDQGDEIPLVAMSDNENTATMQNSLVSDIFKNKSDKLIYVYDFFAMWTFFVEFMEEIELDEELPKTIFQFGNTPDIAPEKEFKADKSIDEFDDFKEELENIDDFDMENY